MVLKTGVTIAIALVVVLVVGGALAVGLWFNASHKKKKHALASVVPVIPDLPIPKEPDISGFDMMFIKYSGGSYDESLVYPCSSDPTTNPRSHDINKAFGRFVINDPMTRLAMTNSWDPEDDPGCKEDYDGQLGWNGVVVPSPVLFNIEKDSWTRIMTQRWDADSIGEVLPQMGSEGSTTYFGDVVALGTMYDKYPHSAAIRPDGNIAVFTAWQSDGSEARKVSTNSHVHIYNYEQTQSQSPDETGATSGDHNYVLRGVKEGLGKKNFGKCVKFVTDKFLFVGSDQFSADSSFGSLFIFPWPTDTDPFFLPDNTAVEIHPNQTKFAPSARFADDFSADDAMQMIAINQPDVGKVFVYRYVPELGSKNQLVQVISPPKHVVNFGHRVHVTDPVRLLLVTSPNEDACYVFKYDSDTDKFESKAIQVIQRPPLTSDGSLRPLVKLNLGLNMAVTKKGRGLILKASHATDYELNYVFVFRLDPSTNTYILDDVIDPFHLPGAEQHGHSLGVYYDEGIDTLRLLIGNTKFYSIEQFQAQGLTR